jgi:putative glutamine amidotransferase
LKPRIAIPIPNSDAGYSARALPQYVAAVEQAGGEAVVVRLDLSNAEIAQLLKTCDGVLLPGSPADVDPQKYGAVERHPKTAAADTARDNVDELLLQDAYNMRKPLMGICYGTQILNVWRTGSLVQHIESTVNHPAGRTVAIAHEAQIAPGSRLASILGLNTDLNAKRVPVNSSHHQSVDAVGDGLKVVARCPDDGVIEAIEGTSPEHFVLGIQWHPERSVETDENSRKLFSALVKASEDWHKRMLATRKQDFETLKRSL